MCQMKSKTATHKLVMPVMNQLAASENTLPKTLSQSILSDEGNTDCVICSKPLADDKKKYDQEIPQSQTADNPVAPRGRAAQPSRDTRKTN